MSMSVSAARFALVGIAVTALHVVVAAGLIELRGVRPGTANGVAFVIANLVSYAANTHWTFQSRIGMGTWRRYIAVSIAAWLLTVTIAWGVERIEWHYLFGIAIVVTVVPILSFLAHRLFTYRQTLI